MQYFLAAILLSAAPSNDIYVPDDAPTIQQAIEMAQQGDRILVRPGVYNERIDFLDKALVLRSTDGPSVTTIDSMGVPEWTKGWTFLEGSGATIRNVGPGAKPIEVQGFTVRGASTDQFGFRLDHAFGVHSDASGRIENCHVVENGGGGVRGPLVVVNCVVSGNGGPFGGVSWTGAGIHGALVVRDTIVKSNQAYDTGGIYGVGVVDGCVVRGNFGYEGGGGAGISETAYVVRTWVHSNGWCGQMYGHVGQGLWNVGLVERSVISGHNCSSTFPWDSYIAGTAVRSSILIGNTTNLYGDVSYSYVEGGYPGVGNIEGDPLVVNAAGLDFSLLPGSPLIDAGDPNSPLDPDGTIADIGLLPVFQPGWCSPGELGSPFAEANGEAGAAIAAWANFVAIGSPGTNGAAGSVRVLRRSSAGWVVEAELAPLDLTAGDRFGHAVALDQGVLVVGARGVDGEQGADVGEARVFRRHGVGEWVEEARLQPADLAADDWFGASVAVAGEYVAVAALKHDSLAQNAGAVYVFRRNGSTWAFDSKPWWMGAGAGEELGKSLSMSGNAIIAGANGADDHGPNSGAAVVFRRAGGLWGYEQRITPTDAEGSAQFGTSVAIAGDRAIVGARYHTGGGAAYIFRRGSFDWTQEQKLVALGQGADDQFGWSVAITPTHAIVGARRANGLAPATGAAVVFERSGTSWSQRRKLLLPGAKSGDQGAFAVALYGDYALVGAPSQAATTLNSGAAWAFHLPSPECPPQIEAMTATLAASPGAITASGWRLDEMTSLTLQGQPTAIASATPESMSFSPSPSTPGLASLLAASGDGPSTAPLTLWPSLNAATTGVGGTLRLKLDNGGEGFYVLAFASNVLPGDLALPIAPYAYGLRLEPATTSVLLAGVFTNTAPVVVDLAVPDAPGLAGLALHFQAWCQQGLFAPPGTASFSNAAVTVF